jgi:polyhydroxyalkanoate synthesis regulator phasin
MTTAGDERGDTPGGFYRLDLYAGSALSGSTSERNRILMMVESGQISAVEAAQLLDALQSQRERAGERNSNRTLRIWISDMTTRRKKYNITATLPINLIGACLHLLERMVPQLNNNAIEDLLRTIESGATGRLLDLQDLEEGKRVEIFVER